MNKIEFSRTDFVLIILVIFCIGFIGYNFYKDRNWEKEEMCITWNNFENITCNAQLYNCTNIESDNNAWMQECLCEFSNSTQKIICNEKTDIWRYNK